VHGRIFVKLGNLGDDLVLLDIARIVEAERADADVGAGADLVLDVDSRGRIGTDEDHRQSWRRARLSDDALYALAALIADRAGDRIAVDDLCRHRCRNPVHSQSIAAYSFAMRRA
jgi:hypothetical protein